MPRNPTGVRLCVSLIVLTAGCATESRLVGESVSGSRPVEIEETPFFPQYDHFCGPAALATILNQSGVDVGFEELRPAVYIPERRGSLQVELVAAIRSHGRVPYRIEPDLPTLIAELHAGRPVLVLQNLGVKLAPLWHYAVVVGYEPDEKRLILRSGDRRRHVEPQARFLRSWRRSDYWGVVALRPDELPAVADEDRYLRAVAAMESVGQDEAALEAYETALAQWPGSPLALLGLGNAHYARSDLANAERAYRELVGMQPGHVIALNNLAQTLADRGCIEQATGVIDAALEAPGASGQLAAAIRETKEGIAIAPPGVCAD